MTFVKREYLRAAGRVFGVLLAGWMLFSVLIVGFTLFLLNLNEMMELVDKTGFSSGGWILWLGMLGFPFALVWWIGRALFRLQERA